MRYCVTDSQPYRRTVAHNTFQGLENILKYIPHAFLMQNDVGNPY